MAKKQPKTLAEGISSVLQNTLNEGSERSRLAISKSKPEPRRKQNVKPLTVNEQAAFEKLFENGAVIPFKELYSHCWCDDAIKQRKGVKDGCLAEAICDHYKDRIAVYVVQDMYNYVHVVYLPKLQSSKMLFDWLNCPSDFEIDPT